LLLLSAGQLTPNIITTTPSIRAYSLSFRLLDRCFISHPTVESQHKFLATAKIPKSLASDAASAAIDAGQLEVAVELLEQGRAILWSKIEGYRYPLDQLRQVDSELADHLESLNLQLQNLALSPKSGSFDSDSSITPTSFEAQMREPSYLVRKWEKVVERVRQVEGFDNFLQAVPFSTLKEQLQRGQLLSSTLAITDLMP
jgi:hypothetical protein